MNKALLKKLGQEYLQATVNGKRQVSVHIDLQGGGYHRGKPRQILAYMIFYIDRDERTPVQIVRQFFKDIKLELEKP